MEHLLAAFLGNVALADASCPVFEDVDGAPHLAATGEAIRANDGPAEEWLARVEEVVLGGDGFGTFEPVERERVGTATPVAVARGPVALEAGAPLDPVEVDGRRGRGRPSWRSSSSRESLRVVSPDQ
ncbi:hypothetical protein [Halospeciosus flavus]|uniref:hypothetical protein n=1 Tax=Halospeciosus flavus TaxID=3032283 RepID=UPI0036217760